MSFLKGLEVAASGLSAQRTRLNVTSSNLANANTTRTEDGDAYIRKQPIFKAKANDKFRANFDAAVREVEVQEVVNDTRNPTKMTYKPEHPDANEEGYVEMPNVNVTEEMTEMITSSRSYEANATAFKTLKSMAQQAIQIA
jgi:flagellar basal-body rod protein FlgC